jgi:hypothetical protein
MGKAQVALSLNWQGGGLSAWRHENKKRRPNQ